MNAQFDHAPKEKSNHSRSTENELGISKPSTVLVHAQLEMTSSDNSEEQEADEMAESIVNDGKIARAVSAGQSGGGIALPSQFGSQLASFQGQGSRLYGGLKSQMEAGFGRDFSDVRIHTGSDAAEMSSSISAKAFTYGNDIYFNRGQFNPDTKDGQRLIAHELTHVVQGGGRVGRKPGDEAASTGGLSDSIDQMIEHDLQAYDAIMQQVFRQTGLTDLSLGALHSQLFNDEPKWVLDYVNGEGYVGSPDSIRRMRNAEKARRVVEVLDNMRGGVFGSVIPGVAMMVGVEDPQVIHGLSQMGAALDSSVTAPLGEKTAKTRKDLVVTPRARRGPTSSARNIIPLRDGHFTKESWRALENTYYSLRNMNNALKRAYETNKAIMTSVRDAHAAPADTVHLLINNYHRILEVLPAENATPESAKLYDDIVYQVSQLKTQQGNLMGIAYSQ